MLEKVLIDCDGVVSAGDSPWRTPRFDWRPCHALAEEGLGPVIGFALCLRAGLVRTEVGDTRCRRGVRATFTRCARRRSRESW
jgi:hypothetical protein